MSEQYKFSACSNDWSASFSPYRVAMTMATPSVEILCNSVVLIVVLVAPCHGSSPFARTALMANSLTRSFATWFMIENSSDCTSYKLRSFLHLGIIVIWVVSGMLLTLEALMGTLPVLHSRVGVRSFGFWLDSAVFSESSEEYTEAFTWLNEVLTIDLLCWSWSCHCFNQDYFSIECAI